MNSLTQVRYKSLTTSDAILKQIREADEAARIITLVMAILMLTSHVDIIVQPVAPGFLKQNIFLVSLVTHLNNKNFEDSEYRSLCLINSNCF